MQSLPLFEPCAVSACRLPSGHRGGHKEHPNLLANLPTEIVNKIGKTIQTRGAQPPERVPYQNRVNRNTNRAVVPFGFRAIVPPGGYESGSIVMVRPEDYFDPNTLAPRRDFPAEVIIGENAFVLYDNRNSWLKYSPTSCNWQPRGYTTDPLTVKRLTGAPEIGHYIARVPATTALEGAGIYQGPPQGIRFFEYASTYTSWAVQVQLAYLAWRTEDIQAVASGPVPESLTAVVAAEALADEDRLRAMGAINAAGNTCCPLCRIPMKARELMERVEQMEGREIMDLTVTAANLFHIEALRPGLFNHRPYNVAWGHYHCNVVARDVGVEQTWDWMKQVLTNAGRL